MLSPRWVGCGLGDNAVSGGCRSGGGAWCSCWYKHSENPRNNLQTDAGIRLPVFRELAEISGGEGLTRGLFTSQSEKGLSTFVGFFCGAVGGIVVFACAMVYTVVCICGRGKKAAAQIPLSVNNRPSESEAKMSPTYEFATIRSK